MLGLEARRLRCHSELSVVADDAEPLQQRDVFFESQRTINEAPEVGVALQPHLRTHSLTQAGTNFLLAMRDLCRNADVAVSVFEVVVGVVALPLDEAFRSKAASTSRAGNGFIQALQDLRRFSSAPGPLLQLHHHRESCSSASSKRDQ